MADPLGDMTESMHGAMSLDGDVEKLSSFYDGWAADYDADVASHGYGLPDMMVRTVLAGADRLGTAPATVRAARLLDAGCGTGLVGDALHHDGFEDLHGIDLSAEMVEVARGRDIYRTLEAGIDLTKPLPEHLRQAAEIVTVGGVFTIGHVGPDALAICAGLVRQDGMLVVSVRQAYLAETDFAATVAALESTKRLIPLVHAQDAPYTMDSTGDYWAWRVS